MDDRLKNRMEKAGVTGIGAAFPSNQRLSMGLDEESAEEAAAAARGEALNPTGEEPEEAEVQEEIPPPDTLEATKEEVETAAQIVDLLRSVPDSRNMGEEDQMRSEEVRKEVESKLAPIDMASLLFNGYVEQTIPLGNDNMKLDLKLRSLTVDHYAAIDRWIYSHLLANIALPLKHRLRFITAAALSIEEVSGKKSAEGTPWPDKGKDILEPDFKEWSAFFKVRLNWLLQMNPAVVELFTTHVTWFEQRIRRAVGDLAYMGQEIKK